MAERRVAMVTGASRGIGRAGALALAEAGFDVVVTGRTVHEGEGREGDVILPGSLERTAAEIGERGRQAIGVPMDVTDRTSVRAAFDRAMAEWGRIDVLVNNAPYSGPGYEARILDIDPDIAIRMAEANYVNQLILAQLAIPGMLESGAGTIINLGSGSALVRPPAPAGEGGWSLAYCATKAALHQVAVLVDVEFRDQGIRAFTLEPGFTITERAIALGRSGPYESHFAGDPPEVAGAVIGWLATAGDADRFLGRIVHAQAACAKNNLLPGWPPPGRDA
jgi:NAD(P)-dependent dehydrogenase (short-subunit alcohol dehydrogenase family)